MAGRLPAAIRKQPDEEEDAAPARARTGWRLLCGWRPRRWATTQSPLALFYRRIKSRIGGKGAITATAHKLACLVYRMLKYGKEYVKQSMAAYEQRIREQQERSLRRKAGLLGFDLVPHAAAPS